MEALFAIGQPVYYHCPALKLADVLPDSTTGEMFWPICLVGAILIALIAGVAIVIQKICRLKAEFKKEKEQLLNVIMECNCVIASVQNANWTNDIYVKELKNEMTSLKANHTRKVKQVKAHWKQKSAEKDGSIASLKGKLKHSKNAQGKLKHSKTSWMNKVAEKEKAVTTLTEMYKQLFFRAGQMEDLCQEMCGELTRAIRGQNAAEQQCNKLMVACKELKEEVVKWQAKCADADRQMGIVQESAATLARAKAYSEAKMAEMEANFKKALLKSKPRLIDLHYFIVRRLPPASRPYASAIYFTLGLSMQFARADDNFQITAAFRRWLECDSCVPRTWGALLRAMYRDFRYEEIPPTWIDDITKELVHGGVAALTAREHFCKSCRQDFSKEFECSEVDDDDSEGIAEVEEESGIPEYQEMVAP